jgi:hypothetical protein
MRRVFIFYSEHQFIRLNFDWPMCMVNGVRGAR